MTGDSASVPEERQISIERGFLNHLEFGPICDAGSHELPVEGGGVYGG